MKRSKVILVLLYTILLTGCGTDSNGTDPRIGSIYESDKANGELLITILGWNSDAVPSLKLNSYSVHL